MDQKAIETLAVNAVRDCVVMSDYLDQYIADNDKEPSFDGFIYLYGAGGKKKKNYRGRIAVQVKGTTRCVAIDKKGYIKQLVCTDDLRSYQAEGGVVYFVVVISKKTVERKIYYRDLLPARILRLLKTDTTQKQISVTFKPLPSEPERIHTLLSSFYEHKEKQSILLDL